MRLISIHLWYWNEGNAVSLASAVDLSMLWFYQRKIAQDHVNFNARTISSRIPPGSKAGVALEEEIGICYCWTTQDGLSCTVITDKEYEEKAAFILINTVMLEFRDLYQGNPLVWQQAKDQNLPFENLPNLLKTWQNPTEADKLMKIEKELFEVKEIVHKNLTDLLKRGEELDSLMEKSKDLNTVSRDFYKKAKKQNQKCCQVA